MHTSCVECALAGDDSKLAQATLQTLLERLRNKWSSMHCRAFWRWRVKLPWEKLLSGQNEVTQRD